MNVLVVAVHPDDETLGCGGAVLSHVAARDEVAWLIVTRGRPGQRWTHGELAQKERQVERVKAVYQFAATIPLQFPPGLLDTIAVADLMAAIKGAIEDVRPEIVYLPHPGDVHTDHTAAFRAAMSVLKPFRMRELGVRRILAYETLSSTEAAAQPSFAPTTYLDISDVLEQKLAVMSLYESERQGAHMPRAPESIRALARYRGATVGAEYAEAFQLIRELL